MKGLLISFRSFELLYITDYKVTFQNQSNFLNGSKYVACSCSLLIELLNNIRVQFHPDFQLLVTSLTQLDGRFALDWPESEKTKTFRIARFCCKNFPDKTRKLHQFSNSRHICVKSVFANFKHNHDPNMLHAVHF